ncbi:MAG: hypothetical protein K8R18_08185 [Parvibaculum sp.]|uniref:hypothetical protein n=1 Tax=Parvibaculum sp. TaxID=2024848 RepID=UPI0025E2866F|nr:hypothetical protein [Parvibaculum sp.]MCE9649585.1 hypothetical protein [Parvibaculum sp.]
MNWQITIVSAIAFFAISLGATRQASAGEPASIEAGSHILKKGETAEFKIVSNSAASSELTASCDVEAGGSASLTFDGEHYIPLSEPTVGDIITLSAGEKRHYDLHGTVEANKGDAYVAFAFSDVPAAMCFPGMQCDGAAAGAQDVKVSCANN